MMSNCTVNKLSSLLQKDKSVILSLSVGVPFDRLRVTEEPRSINIVNPAILKYCLEKYILIFYNHLVSDQMRFHS